MIKLVLIAALLLLLLFAIKQSVTSLNSSIKENSPKAKENVIKTTHSMQIQKIKLEVYYETLCSDSLHFLQYQLEPLFKNSLWRDRIKVELIPYGKAHTTKLGISSYRFYCQHGSRECEGNRLHSCAVRYLPSSASVLHFVTCTMKIMNSIYSASSSSDVSLLSCTESKSIVPASIYKKILSCYKLREGDELLMKHGKRTHSLNPKLTFVPWIVINEKFSPDIQRRSLNDLKGVLCAAVHAQQNDNHNSNRKNIPLPNNNQFAEECRAFYRERRNTNSTITINNKKPSS